MVTMVDPGTTLVDRTTMATTEGLGTTLVDRTTMATTMAGLVTTLVAQITMATMVDLGTTLVDRTTMATMAMVAVVTTQGAAQVDMAEEGTLDPRSTGKWLGRLSELLQLW